ncbi:MAG: AAA family ATPase [Myxococcales bacterium]|nr:AAA family ATPase [Myxococcales bacterium]
MSLKLTRIEIERFRRLRAPLTLDLTDPRGAPLRTVVLGGSNGSGKTSVLEAIALGLGADALITRDLPAKQRKKHWRTQLEPGAHITLTFNDEAGQTRTFRREGAFVGEVTDGSKLHTFGLGPPAALADLDVEYFSSWRAPALAGPVQPSTGGRAQNETESSRLRVLKQRIVNERARRAFARKGDPAALDERWLARLNTAWAEFHFGDGGRIDADVVDAAARQLTFDLFVFDGETRRCAIDQISAGELELVALAGTLITRDFAGLLLIDEPELHLHPEWQTRILPALHALAPEAQIIAATHADGVWDQAYSFERFLLADASDPRSAAWQAAHAPRGDEAEHAG